MVEAYALPAAVVLAVWLLRPVLAQALGPRVPAAPDTGRTRKTRDVDVEDEAGSYSHLASRVAQLEHTFKLLQNEWQDKESRVDSLIKRLHRFRKLEGIPDDGAAPAVAAPVTRESILAQFQRKQGA